MSAWGVTAGIALAFAKAGSAIDAGVAGRGASPAGRSATLGEVVSADFGLCIDAAFKRRV